MASETIKVTMDVGVPRPVDFLRMAGGQMVPVSAVTDEGLREIGRLYGEALVQRAREQREANDVD